MSDVKGYVISKIILSLIGGGLTYICFKKLLESLDSTIKRNVEAQQKVSLTTIE